jgi:hypothetical protein
MDDTHEKGTTHEMDAMQVELVNETETVGTETSVPIHAGTFIVVAVCALSYLRVEPELGARLTMI